MHDTIGFCIVGCGMIARIHVRALAEVPGARVTALVGRSPEAPAKLAGEMGLTNISIETDLSDALKRPDVHAVIICTPSGDHLGPALAAAAAGKHVVVEKPLEITPERCDQIINACDRSGVKLCTIFPSRFADANIALKKAVESGRFGKLVLGETTCKWWRSQEYYDNGAWRGTWQLDGGGALMNQAVHNVDLLLWLMGPVQEVTGFTATLAHQRIEVEDTAAATLKFSNGALGVIIASTAIHPGFPKTTSIYGNRGSAVVEQEDIITWSFADSLPGDEVLRTRFAKKIGASGGAADPKAISHEYHARQLRDFVAAIRENRPPVVDGREGKKAVELICAVYEATKSGVVVQM